jgi:flagellar export protein FliJ
MKKFAFTLQKILSLRQYAEDSAKLELGRAVSVVNRIENDLRLLAQNRLAANAELAYTGAGAIDVTRLLLIEDYIGMLDIQKERLLEELAAAELVAEQKRAVYVEAMKKRAALTKLSERQQEAWKAELLREEDLALDEAGARMAQPDGTSANF